MTDVIVSEWLKLRSLRPAYLLLAAAAAAALAGLTVVLLVVGSYDQSTAAEQAQFEAADPTVVVMPFVAFFIGSIGGVTITSEYGGKTIDVTLAAVPRRGALLFAKAIVVTAATGAAGCVLAIAAFVGTWSILGDRSAPINPWPSFTAMLPSAFGTILVVVVTALLALGVGTAVRSTTVTFVVVGGLLLVLPIFAHFLPSPWHLWIASLLPPNLAPQLAGNDSAYLLTRWQAGVALLGYLAASLTAGGVAFTRRDA